VPVIVAHALNFVFTAAGAVIGVAGVISNFGVLLVLALEFFLVEESAIVVAPSFVFVYG
jgi:hypothetical protein